VKRILFACLRAADPGELARLFPSEADVVIPQPGLSRLVLPPEVFEACRADLEEKKGYPPGSHPQRPYHAARRSVTRFAMPSIVRRRICRVWQI
jgi:hypothetical protein